MTNPRIKTRETKPTKAETVSKADMLALEKKVQIEVSKLTDIEIERAIRKSRGMLYLAAKTLGVTYQTLIYRVKTTPSLERLAIDERGNMIDIAETKLMDAVYDGQKWAIEMILRTLGRERGYVERQETSSVATVRLQVVEEIVDVNSAPEVQITVTKPYTPLNTPEIFHDAPETEGSST